MFSQKESVYIAVKEFLKESGVSHDDGQKVVLTKEQRKTVIEMVAQAAMADQMSMSPEAKAKYNTIELMRGYCNGLLSNWLAKDERLNGGVEHTIKNPGSRAGQGDDQLKNLKALRSQLTNSDHIAAVDAQIAARTAEISVKKTKAKAINPAFIPESLKHLIPS